MAHKRTYKPTLKSYKNGKLSILRDFGICLTISQQRHLASLKSEISIDNFCRKLITEKLDKSKGILH